jgi:SAM-dependent methyltransferase
LRPSPYDHQAADFDARVGLGESVCRAVAAHVAALAGGGRCLDWGCGTGEIGVHLAAATAYTGLDRSPAMLGRFRARSPSADLVTADGDDPWPIEDGTVAAVFGSRSLHLMDPAHVAAECRRVARPDGLVVLIGRVKRQQDSIRDRTREG